MKQITTFLLTSLVTLLFTACGEDSSDNKMNEVDNPVPSELIIPSDIKYDIIKDTSQPGIKRVVQVRLNKRVNENTLKDIALKIKQNHSLTYKRTFIGYYLAQHNKDYGYWATSNFDPNLQVKISGATLETEKYLTQKIKSNPEREIIGSWLLDTNFYLQKLTFFRDKDGVLYLESTYGNGTPKVKRMSEIHDDIFGHKIFENKYYKRDGEYFLLKPTGELELWNNADGHYDTARKL